MTMAGLLGALRGALIWFVEGLVEAAIWAWRRGRAPRPCTLLIAEGRGELRGPDGAEIARFALAGEGAEATREPWRDLVGRDLDLVVPAEWMVRRELDPVAVASRPFLPAFVHHQIERLTPWRADTVHYRILDRPLADDATRLAVTVVLVPKRLVEPWLARLSGLGTVRVRSADAVSDAIVVRSRPEPAALWLRRVLPWALAAGLASIVIAVAALEWETAILRDDIEAGNGVLAERRAVVARARALSGASDGPAARLAALRARHPLAVETLEALAAAVPDTSYLTSLAVDGASVEISGVSADPPSLVPALERSGRFGRVAASAPTTRSDTGTGERFSLGMTLRPAGGAGEHAP